jgi:hypothetical protein
MYASANKTKLGHGFHPVASVRNGVTNQWAST